MFDDTEAPRPRMFRAEDEMAEPNVQSAKYVASGNLRRMPHDLTLSRTRGPITEWMSADDYSKAIPDLPGAKVAPCPSGGFWVQVKPPTR